MEFFAVVRASGVAMGIDVHHAQRRIRAQRLHDGVGDGMIATGGYRRKAGRRDLPVEGFNILDALLKAEARAKRHIAHIGAAQYIGGNEIE